MNIVLTGCESPANTGGIRGPVGPAGPPGKAGPVGPVGLPGVQGYQGEFGRQGMPGAVGDVGPIGGVTAAAPIWIIIGSKEAPFNDGWTPEPSSAPRFTKLVNGLVIFEGLARYRRADDTSAHKLADITTIPQAYHPTAYESAKAVDPEWLQYANAVRVDKAGVVSVAVYREEFVVSLANISYYKGA